MPELPEVESIRRGLETHASGASIASVSGQSIAMRRYLDIVVLRKHLAGRRLIAFDRRGKYIKIRTDPPGTLLVHLGMSGRLLLVHHSAAQERHTHLRLQLADGRELRLVDPRRFGFAVWLEAGQEARDPSLATLGPEPISSCVHDILPPRLKARTAPVKSLLLDQKVVAGVGNIYATEALWRAGIAPMRKGSRTSIHRLRSLAIHLRDILLEAIEQGGTTLRDYANLEGFSGYFSIKLEAYGRAGRPCLRCGNLLHDRRIAGRATVWCPECQR